LFLTFDPMIGLSMDRTDSTSGALTTDDRRHYLVTRRLSSLLTKELDRTLQKKDSISGNSQETRLLSSSYLGENLLLDVCSVLLQGNRVF
jgi:hypothetical protein